MSKHPQHFWGHMHCFVQAANLFVLLLLLILGGNLIRTSPNSVDLIPGWSWCSLYHIDGLLSSLFEFGPHVCHVKSCHTCYSVLLFCDQCRYFVYVNYLNFSICHRLWQVPRLTIQLINVVLTGKVSICMIASSCSRNNVIIY